MTIWWLILILAAIGSVGIGFIWLIVRIGRTPAEPVLKSSTDNLEDAAEAGAERIFSESFREELRNRGRLHFEKIINENAMFLQQDLRLTGSQINEYIKDEITNALKEQFATYEQTIDDAKQMAVEAIQKTNTAVEEQRELLGANLQKEVAEEKQKILEHFEANMADIVNHYVLATIGNQIDLSDQLEYIIGNLSANKAAIIEDIQNGA